MLCDEVDTRLSHPDVAAIANVGCVYSSIRLVQLQEHAGARAKDIVGEHRVREQAVWMAQITASLLSLQIQVLSVETRDC